MQMLCKVSNVFSDVRCPVCGQGFLVYWTRIASSSREEQRTCLIDGLREHHIAGSSAAEAHPPAFRLTDEVPNLLYDDPHRLPAASMLGVYS